MLDHLAAAVNFASVLSPWECEFSSDVSRKFTRASQLSERQRVVADGSFHQGKKAALAARSQTAKRWVPRLTRLGEKENGDGFQSQLEHWRRLSLIAKYHSRAGRLFRVDRDNDTGEEKQVDITDVFTAAIDFTHAETGWACLQPGQAPTLLRHRSISRCRRDPRQTTAKQFGCA